MILAILNIINRKILWRKWDLPFEKNGEILVLKKKQKNGSYT